jgi:DNA-binding NtrC family response regulator
MQQVKQDEKVVISSQTVKEENNNAIRVLHVDDDSAILEVSKLMLMDLNSNLEIEFANSVQEGFKKLAQPNYDVIISDYDMPQKNGLDFLRGIKEEGFRIPFILFTGKGREEIAIEALNMGADGYYNKQGNPETVYGELAHGIKTAYMREQAEKKMEQANSRYAQYLLRCRMG